MMIPPENTQVGRMYRRMKDRVDADARQAFYDVINSVGDMRFNHVGWLGNEELLLDGKFTLEQLKAIVAAWEQYSGET